jgi:SAM-dependent methyltransferase
LQQKKGTFTKKIANGLVLPSSLVRKTWLARWCIAAAGLAFVVAAAPRDVQFLSFDAAQETLTAFSRTEDAHAWDTWVRTENRDVRARIDRGVEDSISNLILYGTSFTALPRAESAETATVASARARVHAMAAALAHPGTNERLLFARDFLLKHGVAAKDTEATLSANLTRFSLEQRGYQEKLQAAHQAGDPAETRFVGATLFDRRGLSVDTSLLPNYALEDTLAAMLRKGAVAQGSIRSIAVIGPGLDFTDKRDGYDFYPLQTIQPLAVIEAVLRLGLGKKGDLRMTTFDLNPAVNAHLTAMAKRARAGTPYVLQLPRGDAADWTPRAVAYWQHFGDLIGSPVAPVKAPQGLSVRAVAIDPKVASLIEPVDLNVVAQVMDGGAFDLVIATNILVYYDRFEQALAMQNIARMMNPGGVFLSNTVLPAQKPAALEYLGRRSISYSVSGAYGDDIVAYRRK